MNLRWAGVVPQVSHRAKRSIGRPKDTWWRELEVEINGMGKTWKELQQVVYRQAWCELFEDLCPKGWCQGSLDFSCSKACVPRGDVKAEVKENRFKWLHCWVIISGVTGSSKVWKRFEKIALYQATRHKLIRCYSHPPPPQKKNLFLSLLLQTWMTSTLSGQSLFFLLDYTVSFVFMINPHKHHEK